MMETTVSNNHKFQSFTKLAEGIAKQWFGYLVFPENFRYQWVISGLASYAAYDVLTEVIILILFLDFFFITKGFFLTREVFLRK